MKQIVVSIGMLVLAFALPQLAIANELDAVDIEVDLQDANIQNTVDLSLNKRLQNYSQTSVQKGDIVTVELIYQNHGDVSASMVVIEEYYGRERFLEPLEVPSECVDDGKKIVCALGTVEAGAKGTLRYTARVSYSAVAKNHTTTATISAREKEANLQNNTAHISLTVLPAPSRRAVILQTSDTRTTVGDFDPSPSKLPSPSPSKAESKPQTSVTPSPTAKTSVSDQHSLQSEFFADKQVLAANENAALILSIANRADLAQTNLEAKILFPFETLDLLSSNQAYSFDADKGELVFVRGKLAPGERWIIRLSVHSGKSRDSKIQVRANVASMIGKTALVRQTDITLTTIDKTVPVSSPMPQKQLVQLPERIADSGAPLTGILWGSLAIGGFIGLRRRFIRR